MKRSYLKRVSAIGLSLVMMVSLAACGNDGKSSDVPKEETTKGDETSKAADTAETTDKTEEKDVINLSTVKIIDSSMNFVDCTADDNIFQDEFLEDLGINVDYKWIADITQTEAKFATMVASGDIPDYFNVANADLAFQLINDGYCMDITDVYENTASEALKERDAGFQEAHDSMMVDGRLYGISELGYGVANELNLLWIRTDWLEQTGQKIPKTMDELTALAKYFKDNVEGCQYGISLNKSITDLTEHTAIPIMNAYNAYAKIWIEKDGKIEYSSVQPEMKDALGALQKMYQDGILDPEFSVKDTSAVNQDVAAGKVGIVGGVNWIGYDGLGGTVALDPNATWTPIEVPGLTADAGPVKLQSGWPVGGYWLISKDCKNPEAVVEMMNYFVENEDEGIYLGSKYGDAGGSYGGSPIYQTTPSFDYSKITEALSKEDASSLNAIETAYYDNAMKFLKDGDTGFYGAVGQYGPNGLGSLPLINETYISKGEYVLTELRGALPEGYALSYGTLSSLEDEYFTRIIMGEDLSLFDEFVEKWKISGGDDATLEVNERYGKQ